MFLLYLFNGVNLVNSNKGEYSIVSSCFFLEKLFHGVKFFLSLCTYELFYDASISIISLDLYRF